jgi:DNA-binding XRE family transcriptional regulator
MQDGLRALKEILYTMLEDSVSEEQDVIMTQNMATAITSNSFKKVMAEQNAKVIQIQNQSVGSKTTGAVVQALRMVDSIAEDAKFIPLEEVMTRLAYSGMEYQEVMDRASKVYLRAASSMVCDSQQKTADRIGLNRTTYIAMLEKHGLKYQKLKEITE